MTQLVPIETAIDAYGMQREVCLRARLDEDGQPQRAPLAPVQAVFRLRDHLCVSHLDVALRMLAERMDVLGARLRRQDDRFTFVPDPAAVGIPFNVFDLTRCHPEHRARRIGYLLAHAVEPLADMRDGPLASFAVVRFADDDYLLCAAFDHGIVDQSTAITTVRRLGRAYGHLVSGNRLAAEAAVSSPGFFPYARQVLDDTERQAQVADFWRQAVVATPERIVMPGGTWRPWRERRASTTVWHGTPDLDTLLGRACRNTGAAITELAVAAVSIALAGVGEDWYVPVTYHRDGRDTLARHVAGPLWDTLISRRREPRPGEDLGTWAAGLAASNAAAPPMRGMALVDFAPLDTVMELRHVTVNVRMPIPRFRFGQGFAALVGPAEYPRPQSLPGVVPSNIGIRLLTRPGHGLGLLLHHDPADLPDASLFLSAIHRVLVALAQAPGTPWQRIVEEVRRQCWSQQG